ncbi:MAG: Rrf2 family transcriptional regulator [Dehalococcoidia bacterium]
MLISIKCDYALRALMELGVHKNEIPIQKKAIADSRGIPGPFLDHILSDLRRSGLIKSFRGPKGGHLLSKNPEEITLKEVILSIEGGISSLESDENCCHKWVWQDLDELIVTKLNSIFLSDLIEKETVEQQTSVTSYSI